jgi:hypothetical protein
MFFSWVAEYHRTKSTVTNRECFVPVMRRLFVPKLKR